MEKTDGKVIFFLQFVLFHKSSLNILFIRYSVTKPDFIHPAAWSKFISKFLINCVVFKNICVDRCHAK